MNVLGQLLRKEFKQIFRNPTLLRMIIAIPIIQLLILPLAADYEIKNINIAVVDNDRSSYSADLIESITSSGYFQLVFFGNSYPLAFKQLESGKADLILEIPQDFEKHLNVEQSGQLFVALNAINGTKASVGGAYLSEMIAQFNQRIRMQWAGDFKFNPIPRITLSLQNWFNPNMNYRYFMVPAILVLLVTMVGAYMCTMNIVREKEIGTIEQINVTPIKKYQFILGKMIPFWIIGLFVFTLGLVLIAGVVYGIRPLGNIALLYSYLAIYLVSIIGFGLLLSTYSANQQQAMSLAFFFMMIFILMSGLFTPVDSMPQWAKVIAYANPVTYFIDAVRMLVMKGSGFAQLSTHFFATLGFAVLFNGWAIYNYKKTL